MGGLRICDGKWNCRNKLVAFGHRHRQICLLHNACQMETTIAYMLTTQVSFLQDIFDFFYNNHKQFLRTCVPIHLISPPSSFNWALYLILCLIFVVMSFEVIVGWALTSTSASWGSSQFNCGAGWAFRASHVIWKSNDNMRMRGLCCLWVYVFYGVLGWKWSNLQPNLT